MMVFDANKWRREARRKKIENGICVYQGCHDALKHGSSYCAKHAELRNSSAMRIHRIKIKNGICTDHGCHDAAEMGFTICRKHLNRCGARGRRSRFNYSTENEQHRQDVLAGKFPCDLCG